MDAKELRIGNNIEHNGIVCEVLSIDDEWLQLDNDQLNTKIKDCKPIPITEEWLLKLGFKQNGEWYEIGNFYIDSTNYQCGIENPKNIYNRLKKVDYVHHLQNLYFALTGEELTLNKN